MKPPPLYIIFYILRNPTSMFLISQRSCKQTAVQVPFIIDWSPRHSWSQLRESAKVVIGGILETMQVMHEFVEAKYAKIWLVCVFDAGVAWSAIGLVVKYLVAIEMPRVRFPDGAFLLPSLLASRHFSQFDKPWSFCIAFTSRADRQLVVGSHHHHL